VKLFLPLLCAAALVAQPARPAAPAKQSQMQIGAWKNLKFGKLGEVKIPDVELATLKNGVKVYLLENRALPFITGSAFVRTGSLLDPAAKTGLADMTASVIRSGGTKSKSGDAIDEQMENIAASVEANMSDEMATVSFNCLKENIDEVLGVYFDVLTQPEFRQDKIDLYKTQMRGVISRRYDDADSIASNEFQSIVYGRDTAFGRDVEYETIDAITRQDLIDFHKRHYHPSNIVLSVSGDFDKAAMKARLEQVFGNWTASGGPKAEFPKVTHKAAPGVYFGEKKDVNQTFLNIGHLGGLLSDKDYAALSVMSDILGGSFDARLFRKVRTELGYAYQVGGGWGSDYTHPGTFRIVASTKAEATVETIQTILKEIERMRSEPVTDQELNTAKEKVANSFVFNFDRPQKTLGRMIRYDYHGYPRDFHLTYQKAIAAVTKADIQRVAKQHIDPSKFVMAVVGNSEAFKTPLQELKLPITRLNLTVKEPAKPAAEVSDATKAKGRELFAKMQAAAGGVEKLKAIRDITMSVSATLGNMQAKQVNTLVLPNKLRQETTLPFGKVIVAWDGKTGKFMAPGQAAPGDMPPPIRGQLLGELFRNLVTLLSTEGRTMNAVGPETVEISSADGQSTKLVIDAATGLPAKQIYRMQSPAGMADVENIYKDWREVGGIKLPFLTEIHQAGKKVSEAKVETATANSGVKEEDILK